MYNIHDEVEGLMMKKANPKYIFFVFIIFFFLFNIFNTYFVTIQALNRYIAPFEHTFRGTINAILGNFSILFFFVLIVFSIFRTAKNRMIFLMIITFILNNILFALTIFNRYFGSAYSTASATLFKNPSDGFLTGVILEVVLELITYYRIILFIPFIVLLVIYIVSDLKAMKVLKYNYHLKKYLSGFLMVTIMTGVALFSYNQNYRETLPLQAVKSTFAAQNLGVYPFYFFQFLGQELNPNIERKLGIVTEEDKIALYHEYNKNKSTYVNFFDQQTYSNRLTVDQAVDHLWIDESLYDGQNLQGILEGRNLVFIHIESMNYFLLEIPELRERLPFLNRLFEESFVFHNFFDNVGMGVSADAELAVLTGMYPIGDRTLYWEYDHTNYQLESLVGHFNQVDYFTKAIHGDLEIFYNRNVVYPNLYGFDEAYFLEDFVADGYIVEEGYMYDTENERIHHSPWISDYHLADYIYGVGQRLNHEGKPFFLYPVTMMPHTPYDFDPNGLRYDLYPNWVDDILLLTLKYLNYIDYYNDVFMRYFIDEFGNNQTLDNTAYIFYSDHGSGLKNGDLDILFDRELSIMETRKMIQHTLAFIYVPGEEMIEDGSYALKQGLLKGEQHLVRGQIDLYRTMIELFNLDVASPYYGVHGLSVEPTFALDNRLMDVVTDDVFFSMRNPKQTFPIDYDVDMNVYEYAFRFKMMSDLLLSTATFQKQLNEAMLRVYGRQ
jgi:lipoteichoic acid synthase